MNEPMNRIGRTALLLGIVALMHPSSFHQAVLAAPPLNPPPGVSDDAERQIFVVPGPDWNYVVHGRTQSLIVWRRCDGTALCRDRIELGESVWVDGYFNNERSAGVSVNDFAFDAMTVETVTYRSDPTSRDPRDSGVFQVDIVNHEQRFTICLWPSEQLRDYRALVQERAGNGKVRCSVRKPPSKRRGGPLSPPKTGAKPTASRMPL
jgi:hypothetical protein